MTVCWSAISSSPEASGDDRGWRSAREAHRLFSVGVEGGVHVTSYIPGVEHTNTDH